MKIFNRCLVVFIAVVISLFVVGNEKAYAYDFSFLEAVNSVDSQETLQSYMVDYWRSTTSTAYPLSEIGVEMSRDELEVLCVSLNEAGFPCYVRHVTDLLSGGSCYVISGTGYVVADKFIGVDAYDISGRIHTNSIGRPYFSNSSENSSSVLKTIEHMVQNIYDRLGTLTDTLAMQDSLEEWLKLFHAQIEVVQLRQELVNAQLDELIEAVQGLSVVGGGDVIFDTTAITDKLEEVITSIEDSYGGIVYYLMDISLDTDVLPSISTQLRTLGDYVSQIADAQTVGIPGKMDELLEAINNIDFVIEDNDSVITPITTPSCDHDYISYDKVSASCTTPGFKRYTCVYCDHSYYDLVQPLGHSWQPYFYPDEQHSSGYVWELAWTEVCYYDSEMDCYSGGPWPLKGSTKYRVVVDGLHSAIGSSYVGTGHDGEISMRVNLNFSDIGACYLDESVFWTESGEGIGSGPPEFETITISIYERVSSDVSEPVLELQYCDRCGSGTELNSMLHFLNGQFERLEYVGTEIVSSNNSITSAVNQLCFDFNDTFSDLQNMYPTDTTSTFSGLASLNWDSTMNGLYSAVLSDPAATLQLYRVPEMNEGLYVPEGTSPQILSDIGFPNTLELTYGGVTHYVPLYNEDGTSAVQGENLFMNYEGIASCYSDNVFQMTGGLTINMGDVPGMYTMSWGEVVSISDRTPYIHFQVSSPSYSVNRFDGLSGNFVTFERPVGLGTFLFRSAGSTGSNTDGVYASVENFKLERGSIATDFAPSVYTIVGIYRESEGIWYALDTSGVKHYFGYDSAVILEDAFNCQVLSDVSSLSFGDGTNMMYIDKGTLTISYTTGARFFTWYVNWERGSRAWWDSKLDAFQTGSSTDLSPVLDRMDTIIESLGAEMGVTGCEHVYVSEINQDQTCILPGLQTFTCESCGSSYSEILASLGHDWQCIDHVEDKLDPETGEVISTGYDIYTCSRCSDSYNDYEGSGAPASESTSLTGIVSRVFEKLGALVGDLLSMGIRLLDKLLTGFDDLVTSFNEKTQQIVNFGSGYTAWLSGFWDVVPSDLQLAWGFCLVVVCLGIVGKKLFFTP